MSFNKFFKISKIFLTASFLFFTFHFLFFPQAVFAQNNSNITIACQKFNYPWCNLSEAERKSPAGIVRNIYQIALGVAGAAALGVLTYGGILWAVSGAVGDKKNALDYIKGALWGVVLLLGAVLILRTINPNLVDLSDPDAQPVPASSRTTSNTTERTVTERAAETSLPIQSPPRNIATDCSSCARLRVNCKNSQSCFANSDLSNKLVLVREGLQRSGMEPATWWVSEAFPPTVNHLNLCHRNGTCVDTNFTSDSLRTPQNINLFIRVAGAAQLRAVYEVATPEAKDRLVSGGVQAESIQVVPPRADGTPGITAPHFSVYQL